MTCLKTIEFYIQCAHENITYIHDAQCPVVVGAPSSSRFFGAHCPSTDEEVATRPGQCGHCLQDRQPPLPRYILNALTRRRRDFAVRQAAQNERDVRREQLARHEAAEAMEVIRLAEERETRSRRWLEEQERERQVQQAAGVPVAQQTLVFQPDTDSSLLMERVQGDGEDCYICQDPMEEDQDVRCIPCKPRHQFHLSCIARWLDHEATCPLDRERFSIVRMPDFSGRAPPPPPIQDEFPDMPFAPAGAFGVPDQNRNRPPPPDPSEEAVHPSLGTVDANHFGPPDARWLGREGPGRF